MAIHLRHRDSEWEELYLHSPHNFVAHTGTALHLILLGWQWAIRRSELNLLRTVSACGTVLQVLNIGFWLGNSVSFFLWRCDATRVMASSFLRFLDHTRHTTVGRTPLHEWSARRRDLYLTTHNTHNRQTCMPPVGFEPTISAGERPQTYALDRADTGTGNSVSRPVLIVIEQLALQVDGRRHYHSYVTLLIALLAVWLNTVTAAHREGVWASGFATGFITGFWVRAGTKFIPSLVPTQCTSHVVHAAVTWQAIGRSIYTARCLGIP